MSSGCARARSCFSRVSFRPADRTCKAPDQRTRAHDTRPASYEAVWVSSERRGRRRRRLGLRGCLPGRLQCRQGGVQSTAWYHTRIPEGACTTVSRACVGQRRPRVVSRPLVFRTYPSGTNVPTAWLALLALRNNFRALRSPKIASMGLSNKRVSRWGTRATAPLRGDAP